MDVDSACPRLGSGDEAAPIYRRSLCVAGEAFGKSLQHGDAEFAPTLEKHFKRCESDAAEQLVLIKQALKSSSLKSSLEDVLEALATLTGAQCAFIGFGNDIMAHEDDWITKCYYNDESGNKGFLRESKNLAIITACRHMRHGKVFLVPEDLRLSATFDGVLLVAEALMAIPLFFGERLVGHMGLMWTSHGLRTQSLSWSYLEMVLHSLEDLIAQRVVEEATLELPEPPASKQTDSPLHHAKTPRQIASAPASPVFAHPLKPFAPSLSHELRTPMQGVVGMLDVMHANVEEAIDARVVTKSLRLLQDLKENIELVQDSARRAVEAADNVVHAYDLNMEIPETPQKELYADIMGDALSRTVGSCERFSLKENSFQNNPYKRRRSISLDWTAHGRPAKRISRRNTAQGDMSPRSEVKNAVHESDKLVHSSGDGHIEEAVGQAVSHRPSLSTRRMAAPQMIVEGVPPTAVRQTKIRELLHLIINESLHVGKRPEFTRSQQTSLGERIDVHALASNGDTCIKSIEWSVESKVPEYLYVDERDLAKLISCVFLNAVKFTESGEIKIMATSSNKTPQYIRINIRDTGTGIPQEFFPNLFKPFAREDDSTTRTRDGLGLGLLVAKGLARKMGGDLLCVRSSTTGPERGSEFEIRVPLYPGGTLNRPTTSQASPLDTSSPNIDANASSDNITDSADSKINKASLPPAGLEMLPPAVTVHIPDQPIRPSITIPSTALHGTGLGQTHPLTFLVAEDNQINRKILVNMLRKLGYIDVYEAYDGREAVRIMQETLLSSYPLPSPMSSPSMQGSDNGIDQDLSTSDMANPGNRKKSKPIDVVLMDLWMPEMDGYEATSKIFEMVDEHCNRLAPMQAMEQSPAGNWDQSSGSMSPSLADISPKVLAVSADVTDEALNRASQVGIQGYMTKPYKLADLERLIVDCCLPHM